MNNIILSDQFLNSKTYIYYLQVANKGEANSYDACGSAVLSVGRNE